MKSLKPVNPVLSLAAKMRAAKRDKNSFYFKKGAHKGIVRYAYGSHPKGEPSPNPNFVEDVLRYHQFLGNNRNPFGCRGFAAHGMIRPSRVGKTDQPPEVTAKLKAAREIRELAAQHVPRAIEVVAEILEKDEALDMVRLAAANTLIDRGYGKATQTTVNATVNADAKPSEIDDRELAERIESALQRIDRITRGETQAAASTARPADLRKLN